MKDIYKLELWNEDGFGNKKDLTDSITGIVLYPYSLGITQSIYINCEIESNLIEIIQEESNKKSYIYDSFIKSDKIYKLACLVSEFQLNLLYFANVHSHIRLIDEFGEITEIRRLIIDEISEENGFKKITIGVLTKESTIVISGKY